MDGCRVFTRLSCLFVCEQDNSKSYGRIRTKLAGQVRCVTPLDMDNSSSDEKEEVDNSTYDKKKKTQRFHFEEDPTPDSDTTIFFNSQVILHH